MLWLGTPLGEESCSSIPPWGSDIYYVGAFSHPGTARDPTSGPPPGPGRPKPQATPSPTPSTSNGPGKPGPVIMPAGARQRRTNVVGPPDPPRSWFGCHFKMTPPTNHRSAFIFKCLPIGSRDYPLGSAHPGSWWDPLKCVNGRTSTQKLPGLRIAPCWHSLICS